MYQSENTERTLVMCDLGDTVEMHNADMWDALAVWPMRVKAHATRDTLAFGREGLDDVLPALVRAGYRVSILTPETAQTEI